MSGARAGAGASCAVAGRISARLKQSAGMDMKDSVEVGGAGGGLRAWWLVPQPQRGAIMVAVSAGARWLPALVARSAAPKVSAWGRYRSRGRMPYIRQIRPFFVFMVYLGDLQPERGR
ncbi:MAG: hypothetical protein DHS20C15_05130 [Planctomycetota bacterium]|nr:MAG: hypothetical protein DHS20C15_05130 [Planctomycetota bacterium]